MRYKNNNADIETENKVKKKWEHERREEKNAKNEKENKIEKT